MKDKSLPPRVHQKGGVFYFVVYRSGIREWRPLGSDRAQAIKTADKINLLMPRSYTKPGTPKLRDAIFARDRNQCVYCGSTDDLCIDHVTPVSKGGTATEANLVTACIPCNSSKHDRSLEQFNARPAP